MGQKEERPFFFLITGLFCLQKNPPYSPTPLLHPPAPPPQNLDSLNYNIL